MLTARNAGRIVGAMFIVQGALAPVVNFKLLGPAMTGSGGFLANAATHATQVNTAVLLSLVIGVLWVGIAVTTLSIFREYSRAMAAWFLALAVVTFSGVVFEGIAVRSMLAVSQEYAKAGGPDVALFQASAAAVRSLRSSAHYTNMLLAGGAFLVLYGILLRYALIPRALSVFGVATVVALIVAALIPLFGYPVVMSLFMPIGLSQLALVLWLMFRGFEERPGVKTP